MTSTADRELDGGNTVSYGLATVRYPALEVTATVEPFENGRGHASTTLESPERDEVPGHNSACVEGFASAVRRSHGPNFSASPLSHLAKFVPVPQITMRR